MSRVWMLPLVALLLCGCVEAGHRTVAGTAVGAFVGMTAGAAVAGDPAAGALVGAAGGGLVGGAVGHFLEEPSPLPAEPPPQADVVPERGERYVVCPILTGRGAYFVEGVAYALTPVETCRRYAAGFEQRLPQAPSSSRYRFGNQVKGMVHRWIGAGGGDGAD